MTATIQATPEKIAAAEAYTAVRRGKAATPNNARADSIPNMPIVL